MSDHRNPSPPTNLPSDVSLLLRAHAEQRWLSGEVIPVVRQIETRERLPEDQLPAAVAYLEVIWLEALGRARETEMARGQVDGEDPSERPLPTRARRYHDVVRALREAVARRVARLLAVPAETLVERGTPGAWGAVHNLTR
jgi:hypothetical protein